MKAQIRETDVETLRKTVEAQKGKAGDGNGAGPILIDVREKDEWIEGYIPGARWIPRGFLELRIEDQVPEKSSEIVLYCAGGTRSALAARSLGELGYTNVKSMAGRVLGLEARRADVRSAVRDDAGAEPPLRAPHDAARGGRGGAGKLLQSKVLLPGRRRARLAGRGSTWRRRASAPSASSTTTWSTRRTCSGRSSTRPIAIGMPKVESAAIAIAKLNPDVKVIQHQTRLDVGERPRHHQGLRPHRRRRGQLPDPLPAQRRGAEAGQAGRRRQHLPVRGDGDDVPAVRRAVLPLLLPGAAAARHGAVVPGGGRARRALRRHRRRCRRPRRSRCCSASASRWRGGC